MDENDSFLVATVAVTLTLVLAVAVTVLMGCFPI